MIRFVAWLAGVVVVAVLVLTAGLFIAAQSPRLVMPVLQWALAPAGTELTCTSIDIELSPPRMTLTGLEAKPPQDAPGGALSCRRLALEVDIPQLWQDGPILSRLEVEGLALAVPPAAGDAPTPPDLEPLGLLLLVGEAYVSDSSLSLPLGRGRLELSGLGLSLRPHPTEGHRLVLACRAEFELPGGLAAQGHLVGRGKVEPRRGLEVGLSLARAQVRSPWLEGEPRGEAAIKLTPRRLALDRLELALPGCRLRPPAAGREVKADLALAAGGGAALDGSRPELEVHNLEMTGFLELAGSLSGPDLSRLGGELRGRLPHPAAWLRLYGEALPPALAELTMEGPAPISLALRPGTERPWSAAFLPMNLGLELPSLGVKASLDGTLRVTAGPGAAPRLAGGLNLRGDWAQGPWRAKGWRLGLPLTGGQEELVSQGLSLTLPAGGLSHQGQALDLGALGLSGDLKASPAQPQARLSNLDLELEGIGRLQGQGSWGPAGPKLDLKGQGLDLGRLLAAAGPLLPGLVQWSPSGALDLTAEVVTAQGAPAWSLTARLTQGAAASPEGDYLAQELGAVVELAGGWPLDDGVRAELKISEGEVLAGTVYLNLASTPLTLTLQGGLRDGGLMVSRGSAGLGTWVKAGFSGRARPQGGSWAYEGRLRASEVDLGPVFAHLAREALLAARVEVAGMELSGSAGLDLGFKGQGSRADLRGRLDLAGVGIAQGGSPLVRGLMLKLPFRYAWGGEPKAPARPGKDDWGRLQVRAIDLGETRLGPWDLPLALVPNRLLVGAPLETALYGGRVRLNDLRVDQPLQSAARATMRIQVEGLDLGQVPSGGVALEGSLAGTLAPVVLDQERLRAEGSLRGTLFGGEISLSHLEVAHPLRPGRELGADLTLERIHLGPLSQALGAGKVTGRLSGRIKGLRVAYGQPVAFDMTLRSVPAEGVDQEVSLKAVNSISVVGTGAGLTGLGVNIFKSFFSSFPYDTIGIACRLENDVFTVRGLIREGDTEYLVKRPALMGINVINRNPNNRISFDDMVQRLHRVVEDRPAGG